MVDVENRSVSNAEQKSRPSHDRKLEIPIAFLSLDSLVFPTFYCPFIREEEEYILSFVKCH